MKISYHVTPLFYLIPLFIISSTDKVYHCTYLILFSATTSTKHFILGPILYKYHPRRFLCDVHHPMVWQNNQDIPQEKEINCLSLLSCWSTPLFSGGMERLLIAWTEEDAQWTPDNVFIILWGTHNRTWSQSWSCCSSEVVFNGTRERSKSSTAQNSSFKTS